MPKHAVKCWIDTLYGLVYTTSPRPGIDDSEIPAIAVPLDLMERLLCVVDDIEVTDDERAGLERLCREMREEVGNG